MTRPVLLNNIDHKDLRVITAHDAAYGDNVMAALSFPAEFRNLQAHYPIVFQKTADGTAFQPVALLGFREGENLFLRDGRWDAAYVPLAIERQPFLIGFDNGQPVVHVDMESARLSRSEGEPVFLPYGGMSPYLERINAVLQTLHEGLQGTPAFVASLLRHELLEPFALEFDRADGTPVRWSGCYIVHEERLRQLSAAALGELNEAGHLFDLYMAVASVSRFGELVARARDATPA
ncbi:MAG TPA: SapC family protein [Ideonella sp.]|jgi:hypothetical protein|nr:SapC family protein [Ideonella sp.]